jgi:hypothetical protein
VRALATSSLLFLIMASAGTLQAGSPNSPPVEVTVKLGQSVDCGSGITIRFEDVLEDSRCPEDVNCVWAGNAKVSLTVTRTGKEPARVTLNTNLEPRTARVLNCTMEVIRLDPVRKVHEKVDKNVYIVRLKVIRGQ